MDAVVLLGEMIRAAAKGPEAVLDVLERPLRDAGFAPRATQAEPRAVVWTRGEPRLVLSGHVDVVPVGEGWVREPFGGEVAEGRVWGRGACDMLGSIACFVEAASRSRSPCAILLTTDEETGMKAAEHALAEGLLRGAEAVVVGEPTSMQVGIAEKGVLWLKLRTRGRNAHGSMPELGDNAAARLVRVLRALEDVSLVGMHPLLGRPTMSLATLRSGEAPNQVPASAEAQYDIRYLPGTEAESILARLRAATPEPFEVEIHSHHRPFEVDAGSALAREAIAASGTRAIGLPYGTEASKFAPAGLPCVILGPGEAGLAHTNRESVPVEGLRRGAEAYARLIEAYG